MALHCRVSCCHTTKWISSVNTYVPSVLGLLPSPHPVPPFQVITEHGAAPVMYIEQVPAGYLFYTRWCMYVRPNLPVYPPPYPSALCHGRISVLYICVSFPALQRGSEISIVFGGDFIIPANFCVCLILLGLRKLERYSCNKYVIITNSGNKYPCNQIFFLVVFGKSHIEKCSKICGPNSWKSKIIMIVGRTFSGFHWKHS